MTNPTSRTPEHGDLSGNDRMSRANKIYERTVSNFREQKRGTVPDKTLEARVRRGEEQWTVINRLSWMADVALTDMKSLRFLDLGSGADLSPDSSPPLLCRFLASKGAELVVGIDQAENNPDTEDVYSHVGIKLNPDTNLPGILQSKHLDKLNLIVTHMFIDPSNPSPTMTADLDQMKNAILHWADALLVPGGTLMLLQANAKVYIKSENGLVLKLEL